jgi:hypothetical protein
MLNPRILAGGDEAENEALCWAPRGRALLGPRDDSPHYISSCLWALACYCFFFFFFSNGTRLIAFGGSRTKCP